MRFPFILAALFSLPAIAATVNTGTLSTSFSGPPAAALNESTTATIDLSNLSGLAPGRDIIITFSSSNTIWWSGSVTAGPGSLEMDFLPRLTLTVAAASNSSDASWTLGPVLWDGGQFVGYDTSPGAPGSFSLTVPWGTDLSAVALTFSDLSSVTGSGAVFDFGSITLDDAILTTSSVPEPSAAFLTLLSTAALLRHRRI